MGEKSDPEVALFNHQVRLTFAGNYFETPDSLTMSSISCLPALGVDGLSGVPLS